MIAASAYWAGLFTGASLIVAIGAQNAFVLTQAVRRNHALPVAIVCAALDALLITVGVCGLGAVIVGSRLLNSLASIGGAVFLFWFGARSLMEAHGHNGLSPDGSEQKQATELLPTLAATLAVSLLNPHVYLDTVVMLGAISANFPGQGRYVFGAGAATASLLWFLSLSMAGVALAPVLQKPRVWQAIHLLVAVMVWWVGIGLLKEFFADN